jgi:hypothetical protein
MTLAVERVWGSPRLELHWYTPAEEMNERFKQLYGFNYPVNRTELIDLVGKSVIRDIDEAREFVIAQFGDTEFFKPFDYRIEAVYNLEKALATQRGLVCNLPQPLPED